jgi:pimeloyl-ACP methyl ester carboxylesterase
MSDRTSSRVGVVGTARVIALVAIVVLAAGLAYLRFAPDESPPEVPADARAGDLTLEPCEYNNQSADCGTIVVPENRADPDSRLIVLPVTRIRAANRASSEPIFRFEGGPGVPNEFDDPTFGGRFNETRDVVLVGYRGVEGSSVLGCPEVTEALKVSRDVLGQASLERYSDALGSCADRLAEEGVDLDGYTLVQRVEDMEAVRVALGYDRINLLSESAGTRTALIYGWRHPETIHRSVMIGVNPPGHYVWYSTTSDDQFGDYAEWCSQDQACSDRTTDLAATMRSISTDMPDRWLFLPINEINVKMASRFGLMETTAEMAPLNAPTVLDSWISAAEGDPSGLWLMSVAFALMPEKAWGEQAATGHTDAPYAEEYYASGADAGTILGSAGTDFLWAGGGLVKAWPNAPDNDQYQQVQRSDVETLLISGQLDFSTPPVSATEKLLPHLSNGHQVVLDGFGHTVDFWTYQPEASGRLIQVFYDTGEVDDSLFGDQPVDFTPGTTFPGLAKMLLAALVGFGILALVLFLWMPRHVKKKGSFGPVAGAAFRILVVPLVMGLGGWFLAVLGALAFTESIPIDNQLLVVVAVGLPIGLGMYWAWVDRGSPDGLRQIGLWAALAGGVVGAWAGFKMGSQLLAPLTAIVGAGILANLLLILSDVSWERRAAHRVSAPDREMASTSS